MAPETAYVQGGQSAFGNIWGGYLPIIHGLRDSLDLLQVQLYNSGTMYGIDANIYTQGTADFIVAMTEAVIQGFNTTGGAFLGLPASKVAVGLPACNSAAGGGFVDTPIVKKAMDYLRGTGTKPGSYALSNLSGYSSLRGMMTWSINWDAISSCGGSYSYANNYQRIFGSPTSSSNFKLETSISVFPNPTQGQFTILLPADKATVTITDILGQQIFKSNTTQKSINLELHKNGIYNINITTEHGSASQKIIVNR